MATKTPTKNTFQLSDDDSLSSLSNKQSKEEEDELTDIPTDISENKRKRLIKNTETLNIEFDVSFADIIQHNRTDLLPVEVNCASVKIKRTQGAYIRLTEIKDGDGIFECFLGKNTRTFNGVQALVNFFEKYFIKRPMTESFEDSMPFVELVDEEKERIAKIMNDKLLAIKRQSIKQEDNNEDNFGSDGDSENESASQGTSITKVEPSSIPDKTNTKPSTNVGKLTTPTSTVASNPTTKKRTREPDHVVNAFDRISNTPTTQSNARVTKPKIEPQQAENDELFRSIGMNNLRSIAYCFGIDDEDKTIVFIDDLIKMAKSNKYK